MKNIFKIILVILTIIIIVLIIKKYYDSKYENFSSLNMIDRVKIYHLKSREPKEGVINPFPASVGSKVLWAYICGETTNPNDHKIDFNYLKSQYPNYICLSFAKIVGNSLMWNNAGCGQYDKGFLTNLKKMHDIGVCISISVGGQDSTFTEVTNVRAFVNSFEMMRSLLVGVDGIAFIDGIDFDIEDFQTGIYPEMGENLNDIARVMKEKGYVVTAVPGASQLTPGCGYSWAGNLNNLINLDYTLFDGVMIQWYQGGCSDGNSGACPSNGQGAINFLSAFSGSSGYSKTDPNNINNPTSIGACYGPGNQVSGKWATDCKDCTTIPSEKIVLGLQTYRLQQTLTFDDLVQVTQSGIRFGGVGWWDINDSVYEQNGLYKNLTPKLANLWKIKPYF